MNIVELISKCKNDYQVSSKDTIYMYAKIHNHLESNYPKMGESWYNYETCRRVTQYFKATGGN